MSRPTPARQDTSQVLSYYFHDHAETDPSDDPVPDDNPPAVLARHPSRGGAVPRNRKLTIVELDAKEEALSKPRRFDRSRLVLVQPPDTAPRGSKPSGSTSPRDVGIVGGSFAALMDQPPVHSLAPLPVFQPSERTTTPQLTPAIGESKQVGDKVAPPVMTRLNSQDNWLPPSPTKPTPPPTVPSRGAPPPRPPRPPRLHSPPPAGKPDGSPADSFRSLASVVSPPDQTRLGPSGMQMVRGNSDYSIIAVSDSSTSERATPLEERAESVLPAPANGSGSSHRREGAFPAHSVFNSHTRSEHADGLPDSTLLTDDRAFYLDNRRPLRVVGESDDDHQDEDQDQERTPHSRKNTLTSLSSVTHTPSSTSHYTQSSGSNYTSSNVSRKQTQDQHDVSHAGTDDMEDLIATVGTALADLGMDPADVPPATVFPPPDESKPSRPGSAMGSTVNLVQSNNSPRTSVKGSPHTSVTDIPRTSMSDLARGSPRPGTVDFPRTESAAARGSPRPSMTEISRGSPRPSLRSDARPKSFLGSGSGSGSPALRAREVSPDKQRMRNGNGSVERPRAREARTMPDAQMRGPTASRSPEKSNVPLITRSSYEQTSPATSASTGSTHTFPSPTSPRSNGHGQNSSPQSNARVLPRARSSTSLARGARSSPLRNMVDQPRFRPSGAPMPESFRFEDVLRMKTSAERAQGYVRKINQLAAEDSGLGYWVGYMKGRIRPSPDVQSPPSAPLSPSALLTTFGPHGPGTRRHHPQPRHVSGGSTTSEATFAVRPDAYVATNISIRAESPPLGPPPSLPYPSLARDIGVRSVPPTSPTAIGAVGGLKAKAGAVGFFSSIGRKTSTTRRDRDRAVMQQARKAHPAGGGYAELPATVRPVQVSAVPTIPGGPRAKGTRGGRRDAESITGQNTGSTANLIPARASVIMIGGRDSFQTMSHDGNGRPVSIRVPSSNGHG
ncbi:hypothetical protein FRC07_005993, partial [Ceratobasidium sp. 392]